MTPLSSLEMSSSESTRLSSLRTAREEVSVVCLTILPRGSSSGAISPSSFRLGGNGCERAAQIVYDHVAEIFAGLGQFAFFGDIGKDHQQADHAPGFVAYRRAGPVNKAGFGRSDLEGDPAAIPRGFFPPTARPNSGSA